MFNILSRVCRSSSFHGFLRSSGYPRFGASFRGISMLNDLNNSANYQSKKRVGRGPASGLGKTSGRGHKGSGQRRGRRIKPGFEGGQTPITKLFPKVGHSTGHLKKPLRLGLGRVQEWIDRGRLDASKTITMKDLLDSRCCRGIKHGVELTADEPGLLKTAISIEVSKATVQAIQQIKNAGGSITTVYFSPLALRAHLHPSSFRTPPRPPLPVSKKDIRYYTNPHFAGYLANVKNIRELYYGDQRFPYEPIVKDK
ncbi:54S ribosomal protein L10, mitochondrial [Schizosaccharomyces pombe]|uniref:Large ribosomal subunit protein uL15m n=1 Tax=Schizosaccharomyces pombe (strain 972 / ATCC 24843) TaxID=284812 RepID=RM10_SCHPO|nr:putative mitochondrial ribosomal protein subunit L15 [Schizosaccharomyces pombe]Q9Y7M5.2 RecName: Full=Large ribosomal subunit protein uL15m; AltName: Full=54S ribosomal protein L10, mitochondrial; Flags: Precursor [Schizosaccharomyces pombe 972h-]CAB42367.2 mitochondrial ribosomal protein subunit L15 (predicted) [Schizosaccharomyces pombe]|eukprot:NP_595748.2 putative mitochondrial ribosomal protein subunit L15 [Schizosaccharomyces pombe]